MSISQDSKLNTLYKKFLGSVNTGEGVFVDGEYKVNANPFIYANKIFSQEMPSIKPLLKLTSPKFLPGKTNDNDGSYYEPIDVSLSFIKWYINVKLTSLNDKPDVYVYSDEEKNPSVDNVLKKCINNPAYPILIYVGSDQIYPSNYILDYDAGVLRLFGVPQATRDNPPRISFWRYEGKIGLSELSSGSGGGISAVANNYGEYLYYDPSFNGSNKWITGGSNTIQIGSNSGRYNTSARGGSIAIGFNAGDTSQNTFSIAIGRSAGSNNQQGNAIAIGYSAGESNQQSKTIAIGGQAGQSSQGQYSIAIGEAAGQLVAQPQSIAIGNEAGYSNQGKNSIAIGNKAGYKNIKENSICIGYSAGYNSDTPVNGTGSNTIVINATGSNLLGAVNNALYIRPIRSFPAGSVPDATTRPLYYDSNTGEITHGPLTSGGSGGSSSTIVSSFTDTSTTIKLLYYDTTTSSFKYNNDGINLITNSSSSIIPLNIRNSNNNVTTNLITGSINPTQSNQYDISIGGDLTNSANTDDGGIRFTRNVHPTRRINYIQPFHRSVLGTGTELHFTKYFTGIGNGGVVFDLGNSKYGFNTEDLTHTVTINGTLGIINNELGLGRNAGKTSQGDLSIAVGAYAGETSQNSFSVAVGAGAGRSNQDTYSVAVGYDAGTTSQLNNSVAVGYSAGKTRQGMFSVAIGDSAGEITQKNGAVCIGASAGEQSQGLNTVAIGANAGRFNQGDYAIAIGNNAGHSNQHQNTIVINATANQVSTDSPDSTYITPIRQRLRHPFCRQLWWDELTGEIFTEVA